MERLAESTGELTESQLIKNGFGVLTSILIITDGTNAATAMLFDNTAGSGKKLGEWTVPGASQYGGRNWIFAPKFGVGLYLTLSGTGASAIVEYI